MSFLTRIQRAAAAFRRNPVDLKVVSKELDAMIASGDLTTLDQERKQASGPKSKLDIRDTNRDMSVSLMLGWNFLREWMDKTSFKKLPPRTSPERDIFLSDIWLKEPILAGAVYSMTAKMAALGFSVTGRRRVARDTALLLSRAAYVGGYDWGGFIASSAQDYYTTNRGVFWETAKDGNPLYTPMTDIGHMDALCCSLTGNSHEPIWYYSSETGQSLRFKPGEFIHFSSLPSPREQFWGAGYCAVDRAYNAATLLMGLHDYDAEKLSNLPPEGVCAISGMTLDEFNDAVTLWKLARQKDNSLTFPQVLWLIGSQPNAEVKINFQGFSQIPESFDRQTVVQQYVSTLALCFGVDAREFWPVSSGAMGTAVESEIQHLKAKGKGPGELISTIERNINAELPEDCDFKFDTQDIEEDANSAAVAKAWIDAFLPLYNLKPAGPNPPAFGGANFAEFRNKANYAPDPPDGSPLLPTTPVPGVDTGGPMGVNEGGQSKQAEQVIDKDQFLQLLADKGVLPDYIVGGKRYAVRDTDIHRNVWAKEDDGHPDDIVCYSWKDGVVRPVRMPPIVINTSNIPSSAPSSAPSADLMKGLDVVDKVTDGVKWLKAKADTILEEHRNIRGEPIPEQEVARGSSITERVIQDELERWRKHPILAAYITGAEEELSKLQSKELVAIIPGTSITKATPVEPVAVTGDSVDYGEYEMQTLTLRTPRPVINFNPVINVAVPKPDPLPPQPTPQVTNVINVPPPPPPPTPPPPIVHVAAPIVNIAAPPTPPAKAETSQELTLLLPKRKVIIERDANQRMVSMTEVDSDQSEEDT